MRIAYVSADPGVPVFGRKGSSVHVQEVVRALGRRGVDIDVITPRVGGDPPPDLSALRVHRLPPVADGSARQRERGLIRANGHLRAALEAAGPFDAVYERYSLWSHSGMEWARDREIPGVLEVNAPLIDEHARHRGLAHRATAESVARRVFDAAHRVLAVSRPVAAWVMDRTPRHERVRVVPNGVDPSRFPAPVRVRPGADETLTVGFVGTLKPWHGTEVIVEAVSLLAARGRGWRLLIVGDGPCRHDLEALVEARGLAARTTFTGAVPPDAIPGLLSEMDIATAPYRGGEECYFSPLKLYEYLAAALPVVASDVGQVREVIRHGVTGMLCRPGDAAALAEAMLELRRKPALRAAIGRAGRDAAVRDHAWDQVAERILREMDGPSGAPPAVRARAA